MGIMNKLFGGGTKLEMKLDANQIPEGGLLSGSLLLHGGKKPLTLTTLKVRLVFVNVTSVPGQSMPKIELVTLIDNAVATNENIAPGSMNKYAFTLSVPKGTDPKGAYKVLAAADIPGVADPTADADLKVLPAVQRGFFGFAKGPEAIDAEQLFARFPGLRAPDEDSIAEAIYQLQLAAYDPEENLLAAEPLLARFMREGTARVKGDALRAWGTILNNRARPEHIKALDDMAGAATPELMRQVVEVAAKFAEEGALPLVERLAKHADAEVRADVATNLYLNAEPKLARRKTLLIELSQDGAPEVRAAAFAAFSSFADDPKVVELSLAGLARDGSPDVQKACVRALSSAHHYGHAERMFGAYQAAARSPYPEVRQEVADVIHWLPDDRRVAGLVEVLLADQSVEVRRRMAWQSCNMADHPELAPLFVRVATQDPSLEVRADTLHGLTRLMPLGDAVALYRQRLAVDASEATGYGVVNGLRDHVEDPMAKKLLEELASGAGYARVSKYAREVLSRE